MHPENKPSNKTQYQTLKPFNKMKVYNRFESSLQQLQWQLEILEVKAYITLLEKLVYKVKITPEELAKHANNVLKSQKSEYEIYVSNHTDRIFDYTIKNLPF